jgi:hypothetical protein
MTCQSWPHGFHSIRTRPNEMFYAKIRPMAFVSPSAPMTCQSWPHARTMRSHGDSSDRGKTSTFQKWSLSRRRNSLRLVTVEDRHRHRQGQRRLAIAESTPDAVVEGAVPGPRNEEDYCLKNMFMALQNSAPLGAGFGRS